jgi:DNA-binding LacI/PurR family transcriptional regulator
MSEVLKKDLVYNQLREAIRSGKMKPKQRLTGELQLAEEFRVSRVTIRKALDKLEKDKLIKRLQGKGTFVAENIRGETGCFMAISDAESKVDLPTQYIYPGLQKRLADTGIKLEHCSLQFIQSLGEKEAYDLFRKNSVLGIFLFACNFTGDEPIVGILKASGLPVLIPHAHHGDRETVDFAIMHTDDRLAFGDGIRYLAAQGHQRVGTIFQNPLITMQVRGFGIDEYQEFLRLNGLDDSPVLTKFAENSRLHIGLAVKELMLGSRPPTAIACFSDFYAIHVYDALKELKIRIPEQVAVMGYCGYSGSAYMSPPLSTVDVMYENIGRMAAELMLNSDSWFGKERPVTVITPHRIVVRESTEITMFQRDALGGKQSSTGISSTSSGQVLPVSYSKWVGQSARSSI